MFISDKFLELLKEAPTEMLRERHSEHSYYEDRMFYVIKLTWVVGPTTIYIELKDSGSFEKEATPTIALQRVKLAKKKYYGLYTARTELTRTEMTSDVRKKVVDALAHHYFDTKPDQWQDYAIGPSVDDYL